MHTAGISRREIQRRKEKERTEPRIISQLPIWRRKKTRGSAGGGLAREKGNRKTALRMETKTKKRLK